MGIIRNKTFLAIVSLALALLLAFIITPALVKAQNQLIEVIVVKQDIGIFKLITADMVELKQVRSNNIPLQALRSKGEIVGKYSAVPVFAGDFITSAKLRDHLPPNQYLQQLPKDKTAVSVAVSGLSSALGGQLVAGDLVRIVAFSRYQDALLTDSELEEIPIGDILNAAGESIRFAAKETSPTLSDKIDIVPAVVTFICTVEQSLKIIEFEGKGDVHLILVKRGSES